MRRQNPSNGFTRSILHVAEKPSMAKIIAGFLEEGASRLEPSFSEYNPIYVFCRQFMNTRNATHKVTSVTGHMMELALEEKYSDWHAHDPIEIIRKAGVFKQLGEGKDGIVKNLKKLAAECTDIILWLDCDREGENICYEVLEICMQAKTNFTVHRALFSAATKSDILRAFTHLKKPNKLLSEAVSARQEIDLRAGAAFSRLQTMSIRRYFPKDTFGKVISYGPCQLPTLGFIVQRHKTIEEFQKSSFWYISLTVVKSKISCEFKWRRERIYDQTVAAILYKMAVHKSEGKATVLRVFREKKYKQKPLPLTTIELQKLAARKLKMSSFDVMKIAEKLYCQGYISYPRTETNTFDPSINIPALIRTLTSFPHLQRYAEQLLSSQGAFEAPRAGGKSDNAHPPIHPVKFPGSLAPDEFKVFDLISRHFLACCSRAAEAEMNKVMLSLGGEIFYASGVRITRKEYLQVYPFESWIETDMPEFREGEVLEPSECMFREGSSQPPQLLDEGQLITLMERMGIGTDATIHEHIRTVQDRGYAERTPEGRFRPTTLGVALVDAYNVMGVDLAKPHLRAAMERDMNLIASGSKQRAEVVNFYQEQLSRTYAQVHTQKHEFVVQLEKYFPGSSRPKHSSSMFATSESDWAGMKSPPKVNLPSMARAPQAVSPGLPAQRPALSQPVDESIAGLQGAAGVQLAEEAGGFSDEVCERIRRRLEDSPKDTGMGKVSRGCKGTEDEKNDGQDKKELGKVVNKGISEVSMDLGSKINTEQSRVAAQNSKVETKDVADQCVKQQEIQYPGMPDFGGWTDKSKKIGGDALGKREYPQRGTEDAADVKHLTKCPGCGEGLIVLRNSKSSRGFFLGCSIFPKCRMNGFLPFGVIEASCLKIKCAKCTKFFGTAFHKVKLYFADDKTLSSALQTFAEEKKYTFCLKCNEDILKQPFSLKSGVQSMDYSQLQNSDQPIFGASTSVPFRSNSPPCQRPSEAANKSSSLVLSSPAACFKCNRPGHLPSLCPFSDYFDDRTRSNRGCFKCGVEGHFASVCPQNLLSAADGHVRGRAEQHAGGRQGPSYSGEQRRGVAKCTICEEKGHNTEECPMFERFTKHLKTVVEERRDFVCYKCFNVGHRAADCPNTVPRFSSN